MELLSYRCSLQCVSQYFIFGKQEIPGYRTFIDIIAIKKLTEAASSGDK